jgi:hypothetical protein
MLRSGGLGWVVAGVVAISLGAVEGFIVGGLVASLVFRKIKKWFPIS